jgi:rhamnose transport system permease protein
MTEHRGRWPASLAGIRRWETVLVVLLIAICGVNAVVTPYFFEIQNLFDSTQLFAEKALIALSMTLVIIGGDIDLSVASIVVLCSTAMGWLASHGVGTPGLVAASLVVGTAAGMFNGAIITRFKVPAIVVTIGTVSLFRGIPSVVLGDGAYTEYPESFSALGQGYLFELIPYAFAVFVVLAGAFTVLLHHTVVGRKLYAYGHNPEAARFSGIAVDAHRFWLFTLNGAMCGLASAFLTSRVGATRPNMALGWDLEVIAVVVLGGVGILGGTGTMPGVVLAIFVMGSFTFGLSLHNVAGIISSVVVGALLITAVALPIIARKLAARRRAPGES